MQNKRKQGGFDKPQPLHTEEQMSQAKLAIPNALSEKKMSKKKKK